MQPNVWTRARVLGMGAAIALAASPALAADESVSAELREMREMVLQLQDQVQNQQAQLEEQTTVIRGAGLEKRSSDSSLSSFLEKTDFSGSIAASYAYNLDAAGGSGGGGQNTNGGMNPFHPDHNSIQLDEVWLSMARSAGDESPVGFGIDIVYGQIGEALGNSGVGGGNSFWLPQAYIEYATHGMTWTVGKFGTHIGYEVAGAANGATITRGFGYNTSQPFSQIGAKVAGEAGDFSWMLGVVNGIAANQVDVDGIKDLIWQLGWGTDELTVLFNGQYGGDAEAYGGGPKDNALVLNGVVEFVPSDATVAWLDVTYSRVDTDRQGANTFGAGFPLKDTKALVIAAGGRQALSDRLGVATRVEYGRVRDDQKAFFGTGGHALNIAQLGSVFAQDVDTVGVTGTLDYLLVDGLTLKGEVQWQKVLSSNGIFGAPTSNKIFDGGGAGFTDSDQVLFLAQLVYTF